jgi:hypothetical protein
MKSELLDKLDRATDKAVTVAIRECMPLAITKKSVVVGNLSVRKNDKGLFDIMSFGKQKLYENIAVFDVAITVAQNHNRGHYSDIKKILYLEERFSKYHTDMVFYLHAMKGARRNKDTEKFSILEDRFRLAETSAKSVRDGISVYKRLK